jgi:hypothetical protein
MNFRRAVVLTLAVPCAAFAGKSGLTFHAPAGWTELSPDVLQKNAAAVNPQVAASIRSGAFDYYAVEEVVPTDSFNENVNVTLTPGQFEVTDSAMKGLADGMPAEVATSGATWTLVERSVVEIRGVPCGRMVGELTLGNVHVKQIAWLLPAANNLATATYSTTPEAFAKYEQLFDDSARATEGMVKHSGFLASLGTGAVRGAVIGGAVALLLGLFGAARRKKA